jgi:hypothetical protein
MTKMNWSIQMISWYAEHNMTVMEKQFLLFFIELFHSQEMEINQSNLLQHFLTLIWADKPLGNHKIK